MVLNFISRLFLRNTYLAVACLSCVMPMFCCGTRTLVVAHKRQGTQTQWLWCTGLVFCGMWHPGSLIRGQTHIPNIARQTPNHWTTGKVPISRYYYVVFGAFGSCTFSSPTTDFNWLF